MPLAPARRAALRRRLLEWYDASARRLPWRFGQGAADPYRVWLAEVMLQQTQVAAVVPYYERFVTRFPTLAALAAADDDEVLALWSGLGYYARCRNLLAAARTALARHGGLPASLEELRALPGFGPYTAGAVASIAFGVRAAAVDGNVARVLARLFLVEGPPGSRRVEGRLHALAAALVPEGRPGDFNQALMDLGATVCRKPAPRCDACPLARGCRARAAGRAAELPLARARPRRTRLVVACGVAWRDGALLLVKRESRGLLGSLWDLPGVEVRAGEDARARLAGALRARFGAARVGRELALVERTLTHRLLTLRAFRCEVSSARARVAGARLVPRDGLGALGLSAATRRLLEAVEAAVGEADGARAGPPRASGVAARAAPRG